MKTAASLACQIVKEFSKKGLTLASAESCTGGLIAKLMTDVAGSSAVFYGACVTYTNEIKERLLGVDPMIIAEHTEVSAPCACAMAEGARERLGTSVAVATTGYAGPTGGTDRDPVGTVYIAVATAHGTVCERFFAPIGSTRAQVRTAAAKRAFEMVLER